MKTEMKCECGCTMRSVTLCPVQWVCLMIAIFGFGVMMGLL